MSRKLSKYLVFLSMIFVSVFTVTFDVEAQDGDFNVVGKLYTFKDDEYIISNYCLLFKKKMQIIYNYVTIV